MTITPSLFKAFLKCPTECWLRSNGEPKAGNEYAEWVQNQNESYCTDVARRLTEHILGDACSSTSSSRREEAPFSADDLKTAKWRFAVDVPVQIELRSSRGHEAQTSSSPSAIPNAKGIDQSLLTSAATSVECRLHTVERIPSEGRGKAAQFVPIRFIFRNKLTTDDKLLLAFDAFVLSEMLGRQVSLGKIIHGDDHATLKVKTSALAGEVRKRLDKIAALLSSVCACARQRKQQAPATQRPSEQERTHLAYQHGRGLSGFPPFRGKGHSRLRGKPARAQASNANQPAARFAAKRHPGQRRPILIS